VQPDRVVAGADLAVRASAIAVAVDAAGRQPEGGDEEVVGRLDVAVDQQGSGG